MQERCAFEKKEQREAAQRRPQPVPQTPIMPFPPPSDAMTAILAARRRFPAGLTQPAECARFGMDALLLAAFVAQTLPATPRRKQGPFLELGCGSGAALLAVALLREGVPGLGVERAAPLTIAARENIRRLGLAERLEILEGTLPERDCLRRCREWLLRQCGSEGAGLIFANPPYWEQHEGRASPRALAESARRGNGTTLHDFCRSAAALLRHKGFFCCIYDARALPRLMEACARHHLGIRRLLPVHPRAGEPAVRLLLEARKDAAHDILLEEALYLHPSQHDTGARWTAQALRFCPFLGSTS